MCMFVPLVLSLCACVYMYVWVDVCARFVNVCLCVPRFKGILCFIVYLSFCAEKVRLNYYESVVVRKMMVL